MLIDTHCHLDWESYHDDLDEMLLRAKDAGVDKIVTIGTSEASLSATRFLVMKYDYVYRTVGYHPDCVLEYGFSQDTILYLMGQLAAELVYPKTVGIGECGLDYYIIDRDPRFSVERKAALRVLQKELFEQHLLLAIKHNLPLSLHVRDRGDAAYNDVLFLLFKYFGVPDSRSSVSLYPVEQSLSSGVTDRVFYTHSDSSARLFRGVLHCVSGSAHYVDACRSLGFLVSFAGNVTYKHADILLDHLRRIPLDEIVVETDGPFLPPAQYRGQRNEPAYLVETVRTIAEVKGVSFEEVCFATYNNSLALFGL